MDNQAFIEKLMQDHNLQKDVHLWWHQQSKRFIIRHHALQSIFDTRGLRFMPPLQGEAWSGDGWHRHIQRCDKWSPENDQWEQLGWAIGEADRQTCKIGYYGVMATYRGIALSGKQALGWGNMVYSEHEADDFRNPGDPKPATTDARPRQDQAQRGGVQAPAYGGGAGGSQGSRFPPAPWATVEEARASVVAGDPPAFDEETMLKFKYKSGAYSGLSWLEGYMRNHQRDGNVGHVDKQISALTREWRDEGAQFNDFSKKKLHTLMWMRTRVDPETGSTMPMEACNFPSGWGNAETQGEPDWMK